MVTGLFQLVANAWIRVWFLRPQRLHPFVLRLPPPTGSPVKSPTKTPSASPTGAPVQSTGAPVAPPTGAPVQSTDAPVPPPTGSPVANPTAAPTKTPTNPPVSMAPAGPSTTSNGIPMPCCSWNGMHCEQPNNHWCHGAEGHCTGSCNGNWLTSGNDDSSPSTTSNGIPMPCCSWNGMHCEQPNNHWCHGAEGHCTGNCNGNWLTSDNDTSGGEEATPSSSEDGCCTWGSWSTCPAWTVTSTDSCQQSQAECTNCSGNWISARRQLRGVGI